MSTTGLGVPPLWGLERSLVLSVTEIPPKVLPMP
jgi:hypothetical protein